MGFKRSWVQIPPARGYKSKKRVSCLCPPKHEKQADTMLVHVTTSTIGYVGIMPVTPRPRATESDGFSSRRKASRLEPKPCEGSCISRPGEAATNLPR